MCGWLIPPSILLFWLRECVSTEMVVDMTIEKASQGHQSWSLPTRTLCADLKRRCGIFQLYYKDILLQGQSSSSLAWITTLQIFLLFILGPFIGKLIDTHGSRVILAPFSAMAVFSVCMLSLCRTYWQIILAQGVAFGLATSGLSLPAMTLATQWFSSRRGLAVGIVSCGSSLGGVVFPLIIPILVEKVGFASAVRWVALLQGILLVIANVLCSSPFPPKKSVSGQKQVPSAGLRAFKSLPWLFFVLGCFFTMWVCKAFSIKYAVHPLSSSCS